MSQSSQNGQEAGNARGGPAARKAAKPAGGARRAASKTVRLQLHLGEQTVQRLGVHAALVGRNQSRLADEILSSYLVRFGKGREAFPDAPGVEVSDPTPD